MLLRDSTPPYAIPLDRDFSLYLALSYDIHQLLLNDHSAVSRLRDLFFLANRLSPFLVGISNESSHRPCFQP